MSKDQSAILASLIGKRLISTLSILDSGDSAGEYVLGFEDVEIVIIAKEEDIDMPWLADTRTVEVFKRPVGAADGNLLYPKPVDESIVGISRIITTMSHANKDGSMPDIAKYDRGLILHFANGDLVIDRGEESWSEIWRATWVNKGAAKFGASVPGLVGGLMGTGPDGDLIFVVFNKTFPTDVTIPSCAGVRRADWATIAA